MKLVQLYFGFAVFQFILKLVCVIRDKQPTCECSDTLFSDMYFVNMMKGRHEM